MAKLHGSLASREFWYENITLIPNRLPDFERNLVDLTSCATKRVSLKTPFLSSPMDTVTSSSMAKLMALMGGLGVIHYNFPTIEEQIREAELVKRFEAAFVSNPIVLSPNHNVGDVYAIAATYGFYSVPITEDGTLQTKMIGLVTHRNVRYQEDMSTVLGTVMTPADKLITAHRRETLDANDVRTANKIIRAANLDTLPIVDDDFRVVALVTDSDLRKDEDYPLATKDSNKRLVVFIAVESRLKLARERIGKAYDVGVDGIVVDASVVFREQLEIARFCRKEFPALEIILGNVDSAEMVRAIITEASEYCDGLRVGIGPGSACKTQDELGTGRAQASAVWDCSQEARRLTAQYGYMPIIADGGIIIPDGSGKTDVSRIGDISKALALGADTVMMGGLLAGLDESPGEKEFDEDTNRMVKAYRGMGSLEAMASRSGVRYGYGVEARKMIRIAEGFVTKVPYRGSGYDFIPRLIAGTQQSLQKQGFRSIPEMQESADIRPMPRRKR